MFRPNEKTLFFTVATPGDWDVVFDFPFKYPPTLNHNIFLTWSFHSVSLSEYIRRTSTSRNLRYGHKFIRNLKWHLHIMRTKQSSKQQSGRQPGLSRSKTIPSSAARKLRTKEFLIKLYNPFWDDMILQPLLLLYRPNNPATTQREDVRIRQPNGRQGTDRKSISSLQN